jgi:hypothetical protein
VEDLPNAATTSPTQFEEACGIAIPNPIPVLIVSSRWRNAARTESLSDVRTRPFWTNKSINSTIAAHLSVAFISGMI